jgi:type VI secretion system protein VasI
MNHYLKVALLTLAATVLIIELFGSTVGLTGVVDRFFTSLNSNDDVGDSTQGNVATLKLTTEKSLPTTPKAQVPVAIEHALDTCISVIKDLALHPDFTQIPAIVPIESDVLYKFFWAKKSTVKTMDTRGNDARLKVSCYVNKLGGLISQFSIADKTLFIHKKGSASILGAWRVSRSVSKQDNSTNVTLVNKAIAGVTINGQLLVPELQLHCGENKTVVSIVAGVQVGVGSLMVNTLIDDEAMRERWRISKQLSAILPNGQFIRLVRLLTNARAYKVSFVAKSGEIVNMEFDLNGLSAAVFPLQQACHWG